MEYLQEEKRFYIPGADGEDDIAEIVFTRQGDRLATIDHTYVDVNYRGQGIGEHLVRLVVDQMREENRKIVPVCPFALREFTRTAEYEDMWHR